MRIAPENWRPKGIADLEPNAWQALRTTGSTCITAGPGAGKSEFLAQKAVYLLETGICRRPGRILAISFKTDAATNLQERVRKRCPVELNGRFQSVTFDAFTKSLVDRFMPAISPEWRPVFGYGIQFPKKKDYATFLDHLRSNAPSDLRGDIAGLSVDQFEAYHLGITRLPEDEHQVRSAEEYAVHEWVKYCLQTKLTFTVLNRLAELAVRKNHQIRRALQVTYPYVFVDEFQDTTYAQYDFLLSLFHGTGARITAVGDDKQRIMTWAGALPDSFIRFRRDFNATPIALQFNFRSSPDLVRIQHVVATTIDQDSLPAESQASSRISDAAAQIWITADIQTEAVHVASWLRNDMDETGLGPSDYVVLVKQLSETYEAELTDAFTDVGLSIRNQSRKYGEVMLQDLVSDPYFCLILNILRLGVLKRNAEIWRSLLQTLEVLHGVDEDDASGSQKLSKGIANKLREVEAAIQTNPPSAASISSLIDRARTFFSPTSMAKINFEYRDPSYLPMMEAATTEYLTEVAELQVSWSDFLAAVDGNSQVPMMTVHKSKGLEYDTVIFVGLDDEAWWSYKPTNPEGKATFFVALTRAKQRAIFSFCNQRGTRRKIADLYEILHRAGVEEKDLR